MDEAFAQKLSAVFTQLCTAGVVLRETGNIAEAIRCFEALALNDDSYEAGLYAFELALCYEKAGDITAAKRFCAIAVSENGGFYGKQIEVKRILGA